MSAIATQEALALPTILHALEARADATPDAAVLTWLDDGERERPPVTYAVLARRARAVGATLTARGARGRTVLLLLPPGPAFLDAFFGCLAAGAIAVPAFPPRRNAHAARIAAIASSARPALALADSGPGARARLEALPELAGIPVLDLEEAAAGDPSTPLPRPEGSDLAFLQYTSGSTASPRGVMVTHANIMANEAIIARAIGPVTVSVTWLPLFHDFGLIGTALQPIVQGTPMYGMTPGAFLQRPLRWLSALSCFRATHSAAPNFAYDLCVDRTTPEERAALDLSAWESAVTGAEPVRAATLQRFAEAFAVSGFSPRAWQPCYGLAEATLMVTGGPPAAGAAIDDASVGCGVTHPEARLTIVDPDTRVPVEAGQVGEIWVRGTTVARGYWEDAAATTETFAAHDAHGDGPWLRTGDLGRLHEGQLHVAGRLKDILLVHGQTLHPHDLEQTVGRSHAAFVPNATAAFPAGDERVVIAQELARGVEVDRAALARHVRAVVSEEFEVAVAAVVLLPQSALPRTTSGKVQRHRCRALFADGTWTAEPWAVAAPAPGRAPLDDEMTAPVRAEVLAALADILESPADQVDLSRTPAELGLDSVKLVELKYRLDTALGTDLDPDTILEPRPVEQMIAAISESRAAVVAESRA
ncbi:MAG: AMP-binding protein [Vicinamibacteria bacterium]